VSKVTKRVYDAVWDAGEPIGRAKIAEATGLGLTTVGNALTAMRVWGYVRSEGHGYTARWTPVGGRVEIPGTRRGMHPNTIKARLAATEERRRRRADRGGKGLDASALSAALGYNCYQAPNP